LNCLLLTPCLSAPGDQDNSVEKRRGTGGAPARQNNPRRGDRSPNQRVNSPPQGQTGPGGEARSQPDPTRKQPSTTATDAKAPGTDSPKASSRPDGAGPRTVAPKQFSPAVPPPPLREVKKSDGVIESRAPSGTVRKIAIQDKKTGSAMTQELSPTGTIQRQVVQKRDGVKETTQYDLGRPKKVEVVRPDKTRELTEVQYNRHGEERARETVKVDARGTPISKTVVVKNNLVVHNTTIVKNNVTIVNNTTVVREYRPCRYGYAYHPVFFAPRVYVWWYDPFWYPPPFGGPAVVVTHHGFRFSWGWSADPWYAYHRYYWEPYPVYVRPSYWVADWMVAGYLADSYATAASLEQTREEVRLAHEEAEKAKIAAQQARDQAEIAEARAAAAAAEARAERAEARAEKLAASEAKRKELELSGRPNPKATPIDKENKEALKDQIEKELAWKKENAELVEKGKAALPDVSESLKDSKHIYPVSKTISVISRDDKPAGTLTAGDMLKAEPGQLIPKDAKETDFVTMRVMTSKGEDDEVPAGTVVKVSLKDLQEFDNEFRAKLDLGLQEADKNKDLFKEAAQK
jgi:hypothetical protein